MEIVDEANQIAKVEVVGVHRNISVALLDNVKVGDWVLVHHWGHDSDDRLASVAKVAVLR